MRLPLLASFLVSVFAVLPAIGEPGPVVVAELYTSQGCSNCPPADALFEKLSHRDDVLALSLHVDYWDYIGWVDGFATPQNTARQRAYAAHAHRETVYTPQILVGGTDDIGGGDPMALLDTIQKHRSAVSSVTLDAGLNVGDNTVHIHAAPAEGTQLPAELHVDLVTFTPQATVNIAHGENAGAHITYTNIVRSWQTVGTWDGRVDFSATIPVPDGEAFAVIVQEAGPGRVLSAIRLR